MGQQLRVRLKRARRRRRLKRLKERLKAAATSSQVQPADQKKA